MFKIKADPTFNAALTIIGQGREQKLTLTFRHRSRAEYLAMLDKLSTGEIEPADALLDIVEKWDADADLPRENILLLQENQPGADLAILQGYGEALAVARKGN
jgi:hypothetical protein